MITVPVKISALVTKHNFAAARMEHLVEFVLLGKKFTVPVSEEFVARLDNMLAGGEQGGQEEYVPEGYALGHIDPSDISDEELAKL